MWALVNFYFYLISYYSRFIIQIYDGHSASPAYLFPDQPEIRRGVWSRPSVAASRAGGSIHVTFTPPDVTDDVTDDVQDSGHVGFKASYWVTNSPPDSWTDKALPSRVYINFSSIDVNASSMNLNASSMNVEMFLQLDISSHV